MSIEQNPGHWTKVSKTWSNHVLPPQCPSAQDMKFSGGIIHRWAEENRAPRAIILGVTPQLYHMSWPSGTDLIAMDNNPSMIANVWPGPPEAALLDDWTAMKLPAGSRDIAITDGGLNMLSFPAGLEAVLRNLHRVLVPGGLILARLYLRPSQREPLDSVLNDLYNGRISNISLLKTRLWYSMQQDVLTGVRVSDIWNAFFEREPDLPALAARIGWDPEHLCGLENYQNSTNQYHFFNLEELDHLCATAVPELKREQTFTPTYEQGEWCPTVVLHRL